MWSLPNCLVGLGQLHSKGPSWMLQIQSYPQENLEDFHNYINNVQKWSWDAHWWHAREWFRGNISKAKEAGHLVFFSWGTAESWKTWTAYLSGIMPYALMVKIELRKIELRKNKIELIRIEVLLVWGLWTVLSSGARVLFVEQFPHDVFTSISRKKWESI